MLKKFKLIKRGPNIVISIKWFCFREEDVEKAQFLKENVLDVFGGTIWITCLHLSNISTRC